MDKNVYEANDAREGIESIKEEFFLSGGSGGQRRDRKKTAARIRAKISNPVLLARLRELYPGSVTDDGEFFVEAQEGGDQHRNRMLVRARFQERIAEARQVPKERIETKPTKASKKRWAENKGRRGELKQSRQKVRPGNE